MSILNAAPERVVPVLCNFWWLENGTSVDIVLDGGIYPFPTTVAKTELTFYATEHLGHEHVRTPPGVSILEYFWDFGDGTQGYGPIVKHTYKVADPDTSIKLVVVDSRGMRWSCAKPLHLIYEKLGLFSINKLRLQSIEGGHGLALVESATDISKATDVVSFVLNVKFAPLKATDAALAKDAARVTLSHFGERLKDTAIATDIATAVVTKVSLEEGTGSIFGVAPFGSGVFG